jgi:hypothetical protein
MYFGSKDDDEKIDDESRQSYLISFYVRKLLIFAVCVNIVGRSIYAE